MIDFAGISIQAQDVIDQLRKEVQLKTLCRTIVCQQMISRAAATYSITVTDEEIQAETDRIRYESRLESAAATFRWLDEQLITPTDWEAGIRDRLLSQKLAEHLFGHRIEPYFAQNQLDYETVVLYRLVVSHQPLAQELYYQIEARETSFYEAAHRYNQDPQQRLLCGYQGMFSRWRLHPDIAAQVFGASAGEVLGPFECAQGFELLMVEEIIPAKLTHEMRQEILNRMFQEWLDQELNYAIHQH